MASNFGMGSLSTALLVSLAACSAQPTRPPSLTPDELLSGAALFDAPVASEPISAQEVFAIDEPMRAFVAERTRGFKDPDTKLRLLLAGMREQVLDSFQYSETTTKTVRGTFYEGRGNCLSFTMLFIALAREAGLRVRYQMVDVPPIWSSSSDVVIRNNHINAVIKPGFEVDYVVDFNRAEFKGNYPRRPVSDDYALALFYSNVGAEALIGEDYETSFAYLRKAIEAYAGIPDPWSNLGLLYSRHGLYEHAESAYLLALNQDPEDRSALTNLVALYEATGNEALAASYGKSIRAYQQRNPYFHYSQAQRAYQENRLDDALALLAAAIRLQRDEHQFHYLRGLVYLALEQTDDARRSFIIARDLAAFDDIKRVYEEQIATLASR